MKWVVGMALSDIVPLAGILESVSTFRMMGGILLTMVVKESL